MSSIGTAQRMTTGRLAGFSEIAVLRGPAVEAAHTEAVGTLTVLHLAEHWLDRGTALTIERASSLGAQFALHALARRHALAHPPAGRCCLAQGRTLLVVLLGGDEQLAFLGRSLAVGL